MLIFATEGSDANAAIKALRDRKFRSALLTAKIPKERKARAALHRQIKRGVIEALVITEMGARGLDVPRLELAINLDVPESTTEYLHRSGRLGRITNEIGDVTHGHVFTLYGNEMEWMKLNGFAEQLEVNVERVSLSRGNLLPEKTNQDIGQEALVKTGAYPKISLDKVSLERLAEITAQNIAVEHQAAQQESADGKAESISSFSVDAEQTEASSDDSETCNGRQGVGGMRNSLEGNDTLGPFVGSPAVIHVG